MRNRIFILILSLLMWLSGCQLALPETAGQTSSLNSDPIIGVYLTPDYVNLFDTEAWLNDHLDQLDGDIIIDGDTQSYEGRLYASFDDQTERWKFENLEGYGAYCWERIADWGTSSIIDSNGGLADARFHHTTTDDGTKLEIDATLYVEPAELIQWYFNPVYQDADGRIYLTSGDCISFSDHTSSVGLRVTKTLSSEIHTTDTDRTTSSQQSICTIAVETRRPAETVRIIWMDTNHQILQQADYIPGKLPAELDAQNAAYLVVEEQNADGSVFYTLVQRNDSEGQNIRIYASGGPESHGALIPQEVEVQWDASPAA